MKSLLLVEGGVGRRYLRHVATERQAGADASMTGSTVGVSGSANVVIRDDGSEPPGLDVFLDDALLETSEDELGRVDIFIVTQGLVFEDGLEAQKRNVAGETTVTAASERAAPGLAAADGDNVLIDGDILVENVFVSVLALAASFLGTRNVSIIVAVEVHDAGQFVEE